MLTRRTMIRRTAAAAGFLGLQAFATRGEAAVIPSPYGPLFPTSAEGNEGLLLALPPDFRYRILCRAEGLLSDGNASPPAPDGMGAFVANGELRLVRNHEIREAGTPLARGGPSYDSLARGGTTTLVVDPQTRRTIRSFVSLSGTFGNCAGGPTPWGTWISCEETVNGPGPLAQNHGYCFEVPAGANAPVAAAPLRWMGRFVHEAAAVDPQSGIVYLTEDQEQAGLYRCVPNVPGNLAAGGRLEMLAIRDAPQYDASGGQIAGARLPVAWVPIADPDPATAAVNPAAVFQQGRARGGARFRRLEGAWFEGDRLFITSTSGGARSLGQVWEYRVRKPSERKLRAVRGAAWEGELTLLFESAASAEMRMPDNLTVSPRGSLLICEDPGSATTFLRVLTPEGHVFPFAENIALGFGAVSSEVAGATFSPDGGTLFLNLYGPGITVAIWGPWERGPI